MNLDMSLQRRIGARIAGLRNRADETQEETAVATGYSRATIAGIEAATQQIGLQAAIAIADHFAVPLDYLLLRSVPPGGPLTGQFVEDGNELALLNFWRSLNEQDREAVVRLLRIPGI